MYTLLITAFSALAIASPATLSKRQTPCMCSLDAQRVADNFRDLIGRPFSLELAQTALAPNFTDYSDSVIELINSGCSEAPGAFPLGAPTFTSQEAFIKGQSTQKPIPFRILQIWNTCTTVILRWKSPRPGFVKPEQEVTGIIVLETVPNYNSTTAAAQPFLIDTVYSEFNSGAWLVDIGNFTCPSTTAPTSSVAASVSASLLTTTTVAVSSAAPTK